ncbi:alpha/beta hydrolase [Dactylosporangium sp. NPDC005572]|uniref:alpha/beta fold hydrolase n=1 Tax=Dactylosporangium sp. NPDC005572 TaxID=3156889 RepID=UPI0033B6EEC5
MADEFALLAGTAQEVGFDAALPAVRRAEVETADGSVSALVWGDEPPRYTFLHGLGLNAHTWDATVLRLSSPALALDLPGHGDSAWRDDFDYTPRTVARAVAAAVEALADGRPQVLVGQSLGGLVALAVAELRPDLLRGLVLVDVSPGVREQDAQQVRAFLSGPLVFESRAQLAALAASAGIAEPGPALDRGVLQNTRVRDDGRVVFKHHFGSPPPDARPPRVDYAHLWSVLEALTAPVLLVRATGGYLPDEVVAEFAGRVPDARIVDVDSRHNVQEQHPARLAEVIADFTADFTAGSAAG